MTSNQQRLKELRQQAKELAEQIERLEDQINNAQPATGLLGLWAKHPQHGDVLIAEDKTVGGGTICVRFFNPDAAGGVVGDVVSIDDLAFPEQTTRPEDVPVGEAWLVNLDDGDASATGVPAIKEWAGVWRSAETGLDAISGWRDSEVTLITPLIPARPQEPETATTKEEYEALPKGTIVAENNGVPWQKLRSGEWISYIFPENRPDDLMDGLVCRILRRGWGE